MNPRCHDITHPPLKGGVTVTNSIDRDRLAAAITAVASMTDDEFHDACEAVGRELHDDRTPEPNNIRSIIQ